MRGGWTLAELLSVLAIVSALAFLLLPCVTLAMNKSSQMRCRNNLRQVGASVHAYAADHGGLMPAPQAYGDDDPATSPAWFHRLPPYLSERTAAARIFQCPAFRWQGPHVFRNACPKSYKMNARLGDRREPHRALGGSERVPLFLDAVAGETGMGQWGHCPSSGVDGTRHGGVVNALFLDGSTVLGLAVGEDGRLDRDVPWLPE